MKLMFLQENTVINWTGDYSNQSALQDLGSNKSKQQL